MYINIFLYMFQVELIVVFLYGVIFGVGEVGCVGGGLGCVGRGLG